MRMSKNWLNKRWFVLLVPVIALANSGCLLLAGSAAAGGAAGYAYYRGNVTERMNGDFTTVWHATHDALYDLGMPVKKESRDAMNGTIETVTGQGDRVKISIEQELPKIPTDPPATEVGVRVATFGDQELSRRILAQVAYRAGAQRPNTPAVPAGQTAWKPPAPR
jgi:hypothetical protein